MLSMLLALLVATVSCKKDKEEVPGNPSPDFMNLAVGNYWVYEYWKIDTSGIAELQPETDSAYIMRDTVVNGTTWYLKVSNQYQILKGSVAAPFGQGDTLLIRDSSGYLIDFNGSILFAQNDFTTVFETDTIEGLLWSRTMMTGKDSSVTVPAGTFTTRTLCRTSYPLNPGYPWGIRKSNLVYGLNQGLIFYDYGFYMGGINYEARLIRSGNHLIGITD